MSINSELRKGLQEEDEGAIRDLLTQTQISCVGYIIKNGGTKETAQDLISENLIKLIYKLKEENAAIGNIYAYFIRMVKNAWMGQKRKEKAQPLIMALDDPDQYLQIVGGIGYQANSQEFSDKRISAIRKSWKLIKTDCKELLHQFYVSELRMGVIAENMGYTYEFVRVKKKRCWDAFEKIFFLELEKQYKDG